MVLSIDERVVRPERCTGCGAAYDHVTGFVVDDEGAHSVYFAACHGHPEHSASIDVVLGTWTEENAEDHVTFSCLLRATGAVAVDAPVAVNRDDSLLMGDQLTRDAALRHELLGSFWQVVDLLAEFDESIAEAVLGQKQLPAK
jgi:hypothetical protein